MSQVPDIISECRNHKAFVPSSLLLADALVLQITDLRSEVTGASSECICFLAQTLGPAFSKAYSTLVASLLDRSGCGNALIRRHAQEAFEESIQYVHSGTILRTILTSFKNTKNKHIQLMCSDVFPVILDTWPLDRYKQIMPALGESLIFGMGSKNAATRDSCAKGFLAFEEEFPGKGAAFRKTLDPRTITLLDKIIEGLAS